MEREGGGRSKRLKFWRFRDRDVWCLERRRQFYRLKKEERRKKKKKNE